MQGMIEALVQVRFQVIALAIGTLFLLVSFFQVKDIAKLDIVPLAAPVYPVALVGLGLVVLAAVSTLQTPAMAFPVPAKRRIRITSDADSVSTRIGENELSIRLGRIEEIAGDPSCALIVLPANEYFNGTCLSDTRSAAGAFVHAHYRGRVADLERAIAESLAGMPAQIVKINGKETRSYRLGTAAYIDRPLEGNFHLLVAAATTEREGEGLRADPVALALIARRASTVARDRRLSAVYLPLLGAGHGSIKPTRALLAQLLAWSEILYADAYRRIGINVVVFRADDKSPPQVSLREAAHLLRIAVSVCEPTST
ncbi:macro domain-containing protein [Nonomuraea sp. NPDC050478]|uniref:macro domain-containing protein n=1 Tax=Nonomuraea sp. NPDC050478 TaxID=3364365 RepID=UPI0037BAE268